MLIFIGLCTDKKKVNSTIVLSGDPKQLDAVTMSNYAKNLSFKKSFMEYLFEQPLYKRGENGKYDPCFIVQLTKNYRSHQEILRTPNRLFYDGMLQAEAKGSLKFKKKSLYFSSKGNMIFSGITDWFIGTNLLPNPQFPVIFQSVKGTCEKINFSWYNKSEVEMVIQYIQKILNGVWNGKEPNISNIGIISPYKKQCEMLKKALRTNAWDGITVGTAETFQGQEREIILISTVRTGCTNEDDLGFVKDERVRKLNSTFLIFENLINVYPFHSSRDLT